MSRTCSEFLESFVYPMLGGGDVHVGKPFRPRDRDLLLDDAGALSDPTLLFLRLRRARELVPEPDLPDPGPEELSLWMGLHNALVFDHPERSRVWARSSTWRRAEGVARTLLALGPPADLGESVARHVTMGAFIRLRRHDVIVPTAVGDMRYAGQDVPRRRLRLAAAEMAGGQREEDVARLDVAGLVVLADNHLHGLVEHADKRRYARPRGGKVALGVEDAGAHVKHLVDDRAHRRLAHGGEHFVGGGLQRVLDDLERDRIVDGIGHVGPAYAARWMWMLP